MAKRPSNPTREKVSAEIVELNRLDYGQLKRRWKVLYGIEPPRRICRDLLMRGVAYRVQERALGGLKPATRRLLERIAEGARTRHPITFTPRRKVGAGTVLIREWNRTSYQVTVLDDGVVYRGKRYRSLSEVARQITGARWSGPLFFGLRTRTQQEASDGAP
jgi:Protein of unknown function (DUF2924)